MMHQTLNGYPVAWCDRGHGVFVDTDVLQSMVDEVAQASDSTMSITSTASPSLSTSPVRYVRCPSCAEIMDRRIFGGASGVLVDVCSHGTWFDAGELEQALAFASSGRMPPSRKGRKHPAGSSPSDSAKAVLDVSMMNEELRQRQNIERSVSVAEDALYTIQWLLGVPVDPYRSR